MSVDHVVMSMCRVFFCVVERGCLLWPVRSPGKTVLAFVLLHSVLQGQICLLLQVFLDFLLLHSSPLSWKGHWTLFPSPVTSTTGSCFCFVSISSFFLELFLHWSLVAYWAPTDLGSYSLSILSFCLFIQFMGFSRQEYWSGLPFPSPVDHILSVLSTRTCLSWFAPQAWLGFIELDKAVVLVWLDWLVFCQYGQHQQPKVQKTQGERQ